MGMAVYYRSTCPVDPGRAEAVARAASELCRGRTWLHCEPVSFFPGSADGHLLGGSKPNFLPHLADAESAGRSGSPDGTARDLLDVLSQLSRDHAVDWEISHDYSDGPIGFIRGGVCEEGILSQIELFADLADGLSEDLEGLAEIDFQA
jgi:hypothetical protein